MGTLERRATSDAPRGASEPYVVIVAKNSETLEGFDQCFRAAGIPAHGARSFENIETVVPTFATTVVVFPDDFGVSEVLDGLRELRQHRPGLLQLIVTRDPRRFRAATLQDGHSLPAIVLPKPSFGWEILDAIRAHVEALSEPSQPELPFTD